MKFILDLINKLFFKKQENVCECSCSTFWEDGDLKVTLKQVLKYLEQTDYPIVSLKLSKVKPLILDQPYERGEHKERVALANLSTPIIVIKHGKKYKSILDGNHRAYKAVKTKAKTIFAYEIDLDAPETPDAYKTLFDYKIKPKFKPKKRLPTK